MPDLAIAATGLVKRYGEKEALCGVDIELARGTVTALLGPNGAGKTTAVRILTTLSEPDAGTATVAGFDVVREAHEVRRRIGLTAQDATVDPLLTGYENLLMVGQLHQLSKKDASLRAGELLESFSLRDAGNRIAGTYSGGMRRRLDLAVTLVAHPEVLFLDEPTTGLDPRARVELWDVLESLVGMGASLLLTTQYLEEADRLADDIVVIDHGRVIAQGDARALKRQVGGDHIGVTVFNAEALDSAVHVLSQAGTTDVTIDRFARTVTVPTSGGVDALATVAQALAQANIEVEDLSLRQPTLDEVFLTLTGAAFAADELVVHSD